MPNIKRISMFCDFEASKQYNLSILIEECASAKMHFGNHAFMLLGRIFAFYNTYLYAFSTWRIRSKLLKNVYVDM